MPNCPHCSRYSAPPVKWRCDTCGCTWCSNGNCLEYSMITEDNDNFTDGKHDFNSNISYIDGDQLLDNTGQSASRVPLSKDDDYKKNDKLKQFDSDYEQMMAIRNSIK